MPQLNNWHTGNSLKAVKTLLINIHIDECCNDHHVQKSCYSFLNLSGTFNCLHLVHVVLFAWNSSSCLYLDRSSGTRKSDHMPQLLKTFSGFLLVKGIKSCTTQSGTPLTYLFNHLSSLTSCTTSTPNHFTSQSSFYTIGKCFRIQSVAVAPPAWWMATDKCQDSVYELPSLWRLSWSEK